MEVSLSDLPFNWDAKPPSKATQFIGDDFIIGNDAAVLKVPSAVIPYEYNYLLNPNHADANKIKIANTNPVKFDPRLKP